MFFSHFWVSRLLFLLPYPLSRSYLGITPVFSLSYPLLRPCLGITPSFSSSIPTISPLSGYHTCFFSLIPTISPLSGYHAYFFLFHTHYFALVWVSRLLFLLPYPLLRPCLGITPTFSSLIPTTVVLLKITQETKRAPAKNWG